MNIIIKNRFLLYKGNKIKCSIGKNGTSYSKKEGDLTTPKGLFKIGLLYYRKDRIRLTKCNIEKKIIKKNMGWCDDIKSTKYNKEIIFPYKHSAEKLYKSEKNYSPVIKGKGSAIFLHLTNNKYKPTKGCIAIQKKDFLKILPLINRKTKISIK